MLKMYDCVELTQMIMLEMYDCVELTQMIMLKMYDCVEPTQMIMLEMYDCVELTLCRHCLLYTSPSPRDATLSRMPSSA